MNWPIKDLPSPTGTLWQMLTYARPHNSQTELKFISKFILPLGAKPDKYNNYIVRVGDNPTILWSCHTDTVHAREGNQELVLKDGFISIAKGKAGCCLGADDGAGVWLLSEMIKAKVPGLYVFHRGEERGGLGSSWIAEHNPSFLKGVDHAIALDRRGYSSVITHQLGGRCCSEAFAKELGNRLTNIKRYLEYETDNTGLFTDTANYTLEVPECTNISVGYDREHGPTESLDIYHLLSLRDQLCETDFSGLPVVRNPHELDDDLAYSNPWTPGRNLPQRGIYGKTRYKYYEEDLIDLVTKNPEVAAEILESYGVDAEAFQDYVREYYG